MPSTVASGSKPVGSIEGLWRTKTLMWLARGSCGLMQWDRGLLCINDSRLRDLYLRFLIEGGESFPFYYGTTTPLHIACNIGAPPQAISYLLSQMCTGSVAATDIEGWVPLHHIVHSICEGRTPYEDGIAIINILCDVDSTMIHMANKQSNTPVDIVALAIKESSSSSTTRSCSEEREIQLCAYLRGISIAVYRKKRMQWEADAVDEKLHVSRSNNFISELSLIPLCNSYNEDDHTCDSTEGMLPSVISYSNSM